MLTLAQGNIIQMKIKKHLKLERILTSVGQQ